MYSERSKVPWGAIIVVISVLVFGCIIIGVFLIPGLLKGSQPTVSAGDTPAPPKGSVAIDISSSNTKEDWMNAMVERFNQQQVKLSSGETIFPQRPMNSSPPIRAIKSAPV